MICKNRKRKETQKYKKIEAHFMHPCQQGDGDRRVRSSKPAWTGYSETEPPPRPKANALIPLKGDN